MSRHVAAMFVAFVLASNAAAQTLPDAPSRNELAVWGARSFATGHAFGFTQDRSLWRAEGRYGRLLWSDNGIALRYVLDAVPLALDGEPDGGHIYGPASARSARR